MISWAPRITHESWGYSKWYHTVALSSAYLYTMIVTARSCWHCSQADKFMRKTSLALTLPPHAEKPRTCKTEAEAWRLENGGCNPQNTRSTLLTGGYYPPSSVYAMATVSWEAPNETRFCQYNPFRKGLERANSSAHLTDLSTSKNLKPKVLASQHPRGHQALGVGS